MERWATFDCYGTLVDWNGGIHAELEKLFVRADRFIDPYEREFHRVFKAYPVDATRTAIAERLMNLSPEQLRRDLFALAAGRSSYADVREGIHLVTLGGQDPLMRFTTDTARAFERMESAIDGAGSSEEDES